MEDLRYIYSVARVRVLETHLLKKEIFLNLINSETLDAALKIIIEVGNYHFDILNIKNSRGINAFIRAEVQKIHSLAKELFVGAALFEAYISLKKDVAKSYSLIIEAKSEFLKDFIKRFIDLYNIKTVLRLNYQGGASQALERKLVGGGYIPKAEYAMLTTSPLLNNYRRIIQEGITQIEKDGNFAILERQMEDYLTELTWPAKYMFFGPEAVFGYCLAKENELKRLHLILMAKLNNISDSEVQERLTLSYA